MGATLADIQRKYGGEIYPLYKEQLHEPYMENPNGIGYQGVVLYDRNKDEVQCQECGGWFGYLANHIRTHKMSVRDYRDKYSLLQKAALVSKRVSKKRSETALKNVREGKIGYSNKIVRKSLKKYNNSPDKFIERKNYKNKIMYKNLLGLCDAQIVARLIIVRDMVGKKSLKDISQRDIRLYDKKLAAVLHNRCGNDNLASKKFGFTYLGWKKNTDTEEIAKLRNFVIENKFIPSYDFLLENDLRSGSFYQKRFGSWRRTKMMAGLENLLEEVRIKESQLKAIRSLS